MKISVTHQTSYHYDSPVIIEPHIFRLQPRHNSAQKLLNFDLQITPRPLGSTECLDQDGTLALSAWFQSQTQELSVTSNFTVETTRSNPFDYVISGQPLQLPLWYPDQVSLALPAYRQDHYVASAVRDFARAIAAEVQFNTLSFLTTLSLRIFQQFRHVIRPYGPPWISLETLQNGEGSCRDLAVLFCDACRVMGIAARFVSGYECASAGLADATMHAWAEVYLQRIGWRGYDPSRGLAVSDGHVAVAAGFDPELASPVAGWVSGWSGSRMETSIVMNVDYGR